MAFLQSRDKTKEDASFGFPVWRGRTYELTDGRIGVVKFIGKTVFKPGVEWIGLELSKGKGKNNGTVLGTSYFDCEKQKGVFVQIEKIKSEVSAKLGRTIQTDFLRKPGAIETGRNRDYSVLKMEFKDDNRGFLDEHTLEAHTGKSHMGDSSRSSEVKKEGAIETGRSNYDVMKSDRNLLDEGDFLSPHNLQAHTGKSHLGNSKVKSEQIRDEIRKAGALETGRADYEVLEKDKKHNRCPSDFLKPHNLAAHTGKKHLGNSEVKTVDIEEDIRKAGPIDIGRADYDTYKDDKYVERTSDFLKLHLLAAHTVNSHLGDSLTKSAALDELRKDGPLDIGRASDYTPYRERTDV